MNKLIALGFFMLLVSCKEPVRLDESKLNIEYFIGEYYAEYKGEIEKIILKESGYYDYAYGKNNDVLIKSAGKWSFETKNGQYVYLRNFPNIREVKLFVGEGETVDRMMNVVSHSEKELGNLYDIVGDDEDFFTFVKLNKAKNKNYLIK